MWGLEQSSYFWPTIISFKMHVRNFTSFICLLEIMLLIRSLFWDFILICFYSWGSLSLRHIILGIKKRLELLFQETALAARLLRGCPDLRRGPVGLSAHPPAARVVSMDLPERSVSGWPFVGRRTRGFGHGFLKAEVSLQTACPWGRVPTVSSFRALAYIKLGFIKGRREREGKSVLRRKKSVCL